MSKTVRFEDNIDAQTQISKTDDANDEIPQQFESLYNYFKSAPPPSFKASQHNNFLLNDSSPNPFQPSQAAQNLFSKYDENDLKTIYVPNMNTLYSKIENKLKKDVRNNYKVLLSLNELNNELNTTLDSSLTYIDNSLSILDEIKSYNSSIYLKQLQNKNFNKEKISFLNPSTSSSSFLSSSSNIYNNPVGSPSSPAFNQETIIQASKELSRVIVERQYTSAVSIIYFVRSLIKKETKDIPEYLLKILNEVNNKADLLANILKKSLFELPNSLLWGLTEQSQRLRILISLGYFSYAAEGYALIKSRSLDFALSKIETLPLQISASNLNSASAVSSPTPNNNNNAKFSMSPPLAYVKSLSFTFFNYIHESVDGFIKLFYINMANDTNASSDPRQVIKEAYHKDITLLFMEWCQKEISIYINLIIKEATPMIQEASTLIISYLRDPKFLADLTSISGLTEKEGNGQSSARGRYSSISSRSSNRRRQSLILASQYLAKQSGKDKDESIPIMGGLTLLSQMISISLNLSEEYRQVQFTEGMKRNNLDPSNPQSNNTGISYLQSTQLFFIPMSSLISFYFVPEIKKAASYYIDQFISEITSQVQQESWSSVSIASNLIPGHPSPLMVKLSFNLTDYNIGIESVHDATIVSSSYIWMIQCLNHIIYECYSILNGTSSQNNTLYASHFHEVESCLLSSICRLLVRFVGSIINIDPFVLSSSQLNCMKSTLTVISNQLFTSFVILINNSFHLHDPFINMNYINVSIAVNFIYYLI